MRNRKNSAFVDLSNGIEEWRVDVSDGKAVRVSSQLVIGTGSNVTVKFVDATGALQDFGTPVVLTAASGEALIAAEDMVGVKELVFVTAGSSGRAQFGVIEDLLEE